ncbi:hypothetical protein SteCoe_30441 [Stentor coeruleus]|uniref:Calcineurin-like phosphoesterase domain-containing protein n=1 Tax=Stentor coeruleus TaxID=5963 RepID=A0A1R2B3Q2_9CILI|nr:hypothetical protein SteCoe_30441 [Stentor coeruleus]
MKESSIIVFLLLIFLSILGKNLVSFTLNQKEYKLLEKTTLNLDYSMLRFHLIGDYGMFNTLMKFPILPLELTAQAMAKYAKENPISFIMTVGDNFYDMEKVYHNSVVSKTMEIFNAGDLNKLPWYLLYGNHDCYFNDYFGDMIEKIFDNIFMPRCPWNMTLPLGNGFVSFTFLSCTLICMRPYQNYHVERQCSKSKFYYDPAKEYKWIEDHLKYISNQPNILWNFVLIHNPIFSVSTANGDSESLILNLLPLLEIYNVDAVLSGHTHNMQYHTIKKQNGTSPYIKQEYDPVCIGYPKIPCDGKKIYCYNKNVTCPSSGFTCNNLTTYEDGISWANNKKYVEYKKGKEIHQIVQGGSGADLSPLCLNSTTPMTQLDFALADFGFTEMTLTENYMKIRYIHSNSTEVLFESVIYT